jgi:hypothetical protein
MQHCLLCGNPDPTLGLYPARPIVDLVKERCAHGPLVYSAVMMSAQEEHLCICRLCFHQLKRRRKASIKKQPLPLDATLLQTIVPGFMRQQDSRTRERMCTALMTPGNSYSRSFEALQTLVLQKEKSRLRSWWEHNLQTEFFAHKSTARLVRKAGF